MRDIIFIATISLALSACGTVPLAPVSYQEPVSVQSVLPVHVRLNTTDFAIHAATTINFAGPRVTSSAPGDIQTVFAGACIVPGLQKVEIEVNNAYAAEFGY